MNAKKMAQKCLSMLLALCMVAGMITVPVHAAESEETFNYVSLGASNTNGYGMRGYITEEELDLLLSGKVSKDDVNVYGYERKPEGSYPDLIRDHFVGVYGADNVNINQLAISSMRVEELRILLDDTYMGDDYSKWRFIGSGGWFESAEKGGLTALRAAYKDHITNADLITVDIGWNNFGVYICNQLVDYIKTGKLKWGADVTTIFDTAAEDQAAVEAKAIVGAYIKENVEDEELAAVLTEIFSYSLLGYMHNFDICMDKIHELNPDADVVVLGIQNLLHDAVVELNGKELALGDLFGNFVNMANYYASARSANKSEYLYVKAGKSEHVTIFLDFMKTYVDGNGKDLNQNVKDCFDYYDNDLYIQTRIDHIAAELIKELVKEEVGEDMLDMALQILKCNNWLEVVAKGKAGELPTNLMGNNYQEIFDAKYWPTLYAAYDTLAILVREVANLETVVADGLLDGSINISAIEDEIMKALEDEIMENGMAAASEENYTVDLDKILVDEDHEVVAAMYVRFYMGNSFFAHPNEEGHKEIRNAVLGIIDNPASEKDQALSEKLVKSVKDIHELLCGAAGHEQVFVTSTDATCEVEGKSTTSCACGKETKVVDSGKLPHTYTAGEAVWAKDYTSCSITFTCSVCGNKQVEEDETITSKTTKEATCKAEGEITYTADFSGSELVKKAVTATAKTPVLAHTWNEGVVVTKPTAEKNGVIRYTCTACGQTKDSELAYTAVSASRISGADRYETSLKSAQGLKKVLGVESFSTIIIASGENFADALTGSYLATVKGAPILLHNDKVMEKNLKFISENLAKDGTIYILGGNNSVSEATEKTLKDSKYNVVRLAGEDRFETNLKILEAAGVTNEEILVCTGYNFADSLSASAVGLPILLVNNKTGELTKEQATFLLGLQRNNITIIGGVNSVGQKLEMTLKIFGTVGRIAGDSREDTSVLVAKEFFKSVDTLVIADSRNYPDGLCGGPLAHALKAPLILIGRGTEKAAAQYVDGLIIKYAIVLGGANSVSNESVGIVFSLN